MKRFLPLTLTAAALSFTACDKEKVDDAKTKTVEAAKSAGEVVKDTTGKVLEKSGDLLQKAGEKLKGAKEALATKGSPALESFKARMHGFSETMKGMKGLETQDAAKAKDMLNQLVTKLNGISTDGVPADLSSAFKDYASAMNRVLKLSAGAPTDPTAAAKWQEDHAAELLQLEKDSTAALKALKEAAAKHGMPNLHLGE